MASDGCTGIIKLSYFDGYCNKFGITSVGVNNHSKLPNQERTTETFDSSGQ
jgi:hypothetical protein